MHRVQFFQNSKLLLPCPMRRYSFSMIQCLLSKVDNGLFIIFCQRFQRMRVRDAAL